MGILKMHALDRWDLRSTKSFFREACATNLVNATTLLSQLFYHLSWDNYLINMTVGRKLLNDGLGYKNIIQNIMNNVKACYTFTHPENPENGIYH
jgi:hypothetical protein